MWSKKYYLKFPLPTGRASIRPGRRESRKGTYKGEVKFRYWDEMRILYFLNGVIGISDLVKNHGGTNI